MEFVFGSRNLETQNLVMRRLSFGVAIFVVARTEQTLQLPELQTQVETWLIV